MTDAELGAVIAAAHRLVSLYEDELLLTEEEADALNVSQTLLILTENIAIRADGPKLTAVGTTPED